MLVFSNCKINIGLRVTAKRPDGYHDIETIFFPLPWYDALEIIEHPSLKMTCSGLGIPGPEENNLCLKAWHLLKKDYPELPAVEIYLHKTIPTGAGLGGGSANGAFMLKALNQKFGLGIPDNSLLTYALQLGSDCPFFILNTPVVAKGRGEFMEPVHTELKGLHLVLVNPKIHISTSWAFAKIKPALPVRPLKTQVSLPISQWKVAGLLNDFEGPVANEHPMINEILKSLMDKGALYASMTGSGSTCYGIFKENKDHEAFQFPDGSLVKTFVL